ncbi:putative 2-aminoethylphosphonate import ATP-binding protein PhnT [Moorella thermoacetica]|uniref:Putative 2-aminoethylphosphonate import ATP-binding protein PhnT n=1 Tax=Neomoorella thermoacetica TaxID=1525 RepID=A0A1J5NKG8_NEOTH|nr:putative 2-aminoethylphosphonate import ATP-binding protein PhnT [Moorella thermoacetica]
MGIGIYARDVRVIKGGRQVLAVDDLEIRPGEVWGLIGPNGAGKSTLLQVLALLEKPAAGEVWFAGRKVDYRRILPWRRQLAVVFQESLLLDTTVFNNVATGLRFRGLPRPVIKERVERWLKALQIKDLAHRPARGLSGGEAQRVSLARALALEPRVLFLDEPFAALDAPTRATLLEELHHILEATGITAVFVTHDFTELLFLADRVAALQEGRIVQTGTPEAILWHPASIQLAAFVGIANLLPGEASLNGAGPARVRLRGGTTILAGTRVKGRVVACLRPEEISICGLQEGKEGANILRGRIVRVVPQGGQYRVEVDCGLELVALAGATQIRRSFMAPGQEVMVTFPPEAVHLIPA